MTARQEQTHYNRVKEEIGHERYQAVWDTFFSYSDDNPAPENWRSPDQIALDNAFVQDKLEEYLRSQNNRA